MICWKCKKEIDLDKVFRTSECSFCHADLHCCKGCRFYMPGNHFDCKESDLEPVADKEKANFCDFFSAADNNLLNNTANDKSQVALDSFNALFGDKPVEKKSDSAKDAFNALFGGGLCL